MAYAAVVSLVQTLKQLLHSDHHQSPLHYPKPQIESLHDKLCSLQSTLEKIFPVKQSIRRDVNDLETKIRDAAYEAQDAVEFFLSRQSLEPEPASLRIDNFLRDLQEIMKKIDSNTVEAEKIAGSIQSSKEGQQQAGRSFSENASSARAASSSKTKIVGQEKDYERVMKQLTNDTLKELQVVPITGMAGIGKTTLAKSLYEDQLTERLFDVRAWVTVSQEYHVRDIFLRLLGSMAKKGQKSDVSGSANKLGDEVSKENDAQLTLRLHQKLYETRYLIVIDDMWDKSVWDRVRQYFPDDKKGSRILLTTRLVEVAKYAKPKGFHHQMSLLDEDNSWKLLCQTVFGKEHCPVQFAQLETIGRGISNNCKGLPLSITVVGGLLFKERKTEQYWQIVGEDTNAAAAKSEQPYLELLSLSYNHLPGKLKGCFLYLGAFPEDNEIFVSKLIQLWVAEGFLPPPSPPHQSMEQVAEHYLEDLIDRNLVSSRRKTSSGRTKTCGIHDTLRDLAMEECRKEKFFHAIYSHDQRSSKASKNSQRRVSVHKNILMCLEDVYNSTKSITLARSLLYAGQHHHHPLPFCLTFELLRVLDALTVYFISFPAEIAKLIHLRYLSLTYNRKLPKTISKLRNLQALIVRRHPRIISSSKSFLPMEIWDMPQLRHLIFTESSLPLPILAQNSSALLENLQTLSNVNVACLTKEVLRNVPNLKKLGVWISAPRAVEFYLDELKQLEAFKFTVLSPVPEAKVEFLPKLVFPETLRKLSLSGCGIPWEDMTVIGQLPHLQVLKLREFACRGPEWEPNQYEFRGLKFLLLESLDLKTWGADYTHFPELESLIIRHCYELEEMSTEIGEIGCLQLIELVDCCRYAVKWAEYVTQDQEEAGNKVLQVRIYSSWE